jgi:signal transduction histidine kinase
VVDRAVKDALPIAQEKGLSVETSIPAQLPQIFADPRRIRQILTKKDLS